jgi:hypothetical protein
MKETKLRLTIGSDAAFLLENPERTALFAEVYSDMTVQLVRADIAMVQERCRLILEALNK